jgi:GNAT superfamily N-acetyltransferase
VDARRIEGSEKLERYAALHNAVNPDDAVMLADVRGWTASLRDSAFFAVGDVAVRWVAADWRPLPEARILVLAAHRRRGVGSALFAEVSAWAAARGHGELEARVRERHADGLAFAEHRGFVEIGREQGLELDLTGTEPPVVAPPEHLEI